MLTDHGTIYKYGAVYSPMYKLVLSIITIEIERIFNSNKTGSKHNMGYKVLKKAYSYLYNLRITNQRLDEKRIKEIKSGLLQDIYQ